MARVVSVLDIEPEDKEYIQYTLECNREEVFDVVGNRLYLPLSFAEKTFVLEPVQPKQTESMAFVGELRAEQLQVKDFVIGRGGTAIVKAQPGFGKTITAIAIACHFGVKTAVVVNKLVLLNQWVEAIGRFAPAARVQVVTPRDSQLNPAASVYLVNAVNIVKHSHKFWSSVKFLIVDELHQIVTKKLCIGLLRFVPFAVLGLSATPYRHDEYNEAIEWFFGTESVGDAFRHTHRYRIVETHWTPKNISYTNKGLDWSKILDEQSQNPSRNRLVASECVKQVSAGSTVLVLVKRVCHAELIKQLLTAAGIEPVAVLAGTLKTFNKSCKVLIGTTQKIGVGFDHAPIDCLVVAADVKQYFVQYLGRCMRTADVVPTVVDFRDNFNTLQKHLAVRIEKYRTCGGTPAE